MYLYIKSVGNRIHGEKKYFLYQISLPLARIKTVNTGITLYYLSIAPLDILAET